MFDNVIKEYKFKMNQILLETPTEIVKPTMKNYNNIVCCNCGGLGHVYARCNHPITSYGIICYRLVYDEKGNSIFPEFLMVQRKDSLSYVEFMRGKYDLQNLSYLMKLFSNMIEEEREKLFNNDFESLWKGLWSFSGGKSFMKDYNASKEKFHILKNGFYLKQGNDKKVYVNFEYLRDMTQSMLDETEWGFPKGRRNITDEDDRRCALREFKEETGINLKNIRFIREIKPFEEVFNGSNKVRYKHVYYIAKYSQSSLNVLELFDPTNKHQAREIKDVQWFNYNDAQEKIKPYHIERKELLKRVNNLILKSFSQL